jgi:hypothetical protein
LAAITELLFSAFILFLIVNDVRNEILYQMNPGVGPAMERVSFISKVPYHIAGYLLTTGGTLLLLKRRAGLHASLAGLLLLLGYIIGYQSFIYRHIIDPISNPAAFILFGVLSCSLPALIMGWRKVKWN